MGWKEVYRGCKGEKRTETELRGDTGEEGPVYISFRLNGFAVSFVRVC